MTEPPDHMLPSERATAPPSQTRAYMLMAGGVSARAALLLPSATEQIDDMIACAPTYAQSILTWEHGWPRSYEHLRIPLDLRQSINQSVLAAGEAAVESARGWLLALVGALHAPILALWAVGFLGVLRLVEDYVIYPRLVRRGIQLHPLAVIIAVLTGAELNGVAGVFLAVPTVAIASVVYRHWLEWRSADRIVAETFLRTPPSVLR